MSMGMIDMVDRGIGLESSGIVGVSRPSFLHLDILL